MSFGDDDGKKRKTNGCHFGRAHPKHGVRSCVTERWSRFFRESRERIDQRKKKKKINGRLPVTPPPPPAASFFLFFFQRSRATHHAAGLKAAAGAATRFFPPRRRDARWLPAKTRDNQPTNKKQRKCKFFVQPLLLSRDTCYGSVEGGFEGRWVVFVLFSSVASFDHSLLALRRALPPLLVSLHPLSFPLPSPRHDGHHQPRQPQRRLDEG